MSTTDEKVLILVKPAGLSDVPQTTVRPSHHRIRAHLIPHEAIEHAALLCVILCLNSKLQELKVPCQRHQRNIPAIFSRTSPFEIPIQRSFGSSPKINAR